MTLLTSVVAADYALVAVDSAAFAPDGQHVGSISKFALIPHARALLAVQGEHMLLSFLASNSWTISGVDEAEHVMPRLLSEAAARMPRQLAPRGENVGSAVHLIGYSPSRGRMVLHTWLSTDGFITVEHDTKIKPSGHGLIIARPAPAPQPKGPIANAEDLQRYVHQHVAYLRTLNPSEPVGGQCVIARLDRHGVRITYGEDLGAPGGGTRAKTPGEPLHAVLRETGGAIFNLDTTFATLDVAANTGLPRPDVVEQITGVAITSGSSIELDKSILSRTTVTWTAATTQQVRQSGSIEVQYRRGGEAAPSGDWPSVVVPGNATSATIVGLGQGLHYVFRVRARTTLGARGDWSVLEIGQVATVPQVDTGGIAADAVAPIATAVQVGSTNVYLTDVTIASTSIDSQGYPIYVSFSVDCSGGYSGDKATFYVKVNGTTSYTKEITATRDGSQIGNPWSIDGALVQTVIASPGTGSKTISIDAVGTHATYGVTVENGNLYVEGKLR